MSCVHEDFYFNLSERNINLKITFEEMKTSLFLYSVDFH